MVEKSYTPSPLPSDKRGDVLFPFMRDFLPTIKKRFCTLLCILFSAGLFSNAHAQIITTVAGNGTAAYSGDGGQATAAGFAYPIDVTTDAAGNIYIADYTGNRVRKVTPAGIISTFAGTGTAGSGGDGGQATAATLVAPAGVAVDLSGNVYITEYSANRIRKVNTSGVISTFAGTGVAGFSGDGGQATAAQFTYPWGIAVDGSNNVYIADEYNHRIRKVNASGIISTFAGNGSAGYITDGVAATATQIYYPGYISLDAAGNVYFSDYGNNRVRSVNTSGIISTVAGNGTFGFSGDGTAATTAMISNPYGVGTDAAGNVYISDYINYRIRKANTAGIINTIAGTGSPGFSGDGGQATAATINTVYGVHVDGVQNIFIADAANHRIRKIVGHNRLPTFTDGHSQAFTVCENTVGDSINSLLAVHDSDAYQLETWSVITAPGHGTAVAATTIISTGGTVTPAGTFYTPTAGYSGADSFKVRVTDGIASDTTTIDVTINPGPAAITGPTAFTLGYYTTLSSATSGGTWSSGSAGIATITGAGVVVGVAVGTVGITYTLSTGCIATTTVSVSAYAGTMITTIAGNGTAGFTGDGGQATAAELRTAVDVTVDGSGNVYIADETNLRIRLVNTSGIISTYAGGGGSFDDGIPATSASLGPISVAMGGNRNLYIGDGENLLVRKVSTSGTITTIAGNWLSGYTGDGGPATAAEIDIPQGIAADGAGNVYIVSQDSNRVRKINSSGIITTFAGGGSSGLGDGGPATMAQLSSPTGVAVDGTGNIFIADFGNGRIRKVNASGVITTIAGNGSGGYSGDGGPATAAAMSPWHVIVDQLGNVYITTIDNRVRKINTSGIISTIAGNGSAGYSGDGCAASASILSSYSPGIAVDATGNILINDANNQRVRKISSNHAPAFTGGHTQAISVCENSTDTLNSFLAITDIDNAQGETWSVLTTAAHGALAASYTGTSTGGTLTPAGLYYAPTTGYTGADSFIVIVTDCSGGADTTKIVVNISPPPSAITGTATVCAGLTTTLSDPVGSGTWSSSNTAKATVTAGPAGGGVVTGVSAGTATITYSPGAGCAVTKAVTVNDAPSPISGSSRVCRSFTTTLTDPSSGGTWSSSNSGIAAVGTSGVVSGVTVGTATISYTLGGCPAVLTMTVNSNPSFITGITTICSGSLSALFDGIPGGTWSSGNTVVATADSLSGLVTGSAPGAALITYTLPTGCSAATTVVVNPLPALPVFAGTTTICIGSTTTLTDPTGGGVWSISGLASAATVDSFSGTVTGTSPGTATILYTLTTGCSAAATVTVNAGTAAITGVPNVCVGSVVTLSDATTGGAWSSSNTAIASVAPGTGMVTGVAPGTAIITYSTGAGCSSTYLITVNTAPSAISGVTSVCVSLTTALGDVTTGGTWSSSNTSVATVSTTGSMGGVAAGAAVITYTISSGCYATATVLVNSSPGSITGTTHVCQGTTIPLGDPVPGGVWSSSNTGIATVGTTGGMVSGGSPGTVIITYSLGAGCSASTTVTVNPLPTAISGPSTVCAGLTITLTDGGGGTWSSGNTSVATVGTSPGAVTGASAGTGVIIYTLPTGCAITKLITVNALPASISGTLSVCSGSTTALTGGSGTWSSGSTAIATVVSTTGVISGVSPGTSLITYTASTGCTRSVTVTVNPLPVVPSVTGGGAAAVCVAATIALTDGTGGGTWSTGSTGTATAGSTTGIVTGISPGIATIIYTIGTGCAKTIAVTVNPLPTAITGPSAECAGANITEADGITGGTWSSGTTTVATITPGPSGGGVVYGIATGATAITYTLPTGCSITRTVTVSPGPVGISGASFVCVGAITGLTDAISGGAWSSSNSAAATVGWATGIVTGAAPGTTVITYSLGTGCTVTKTITVNASPASITGTTNVCVGSTIILADATTGGTWSPASGSIATVNASGVVIGASAGTAAISYTVAGCMVTTLVTVNPAPTIIGGPSAVCMGTTITLSEGITGGTWTSGNTAIATVSTTGMVRGMSSGSAAITYSLGGGCIATKIITVNPIYAITGAAGLCVGAATTLADLAIGGTWSSGNTTIATVISASGVVSAIAPGTSVITYTTPAGCTATTTVTVNSGPAAITGSLHACIGTTTALSDAAGGGTWTSGNTAAATIVTATGVVTGVTTGMSIITYLLGTGCTTTATVTVNPSPSPVTGVAAVCAGSTTILSDATGGGTWSPASGGVAAVNASGTVTGVSAGTAVITYTPATGCFAIKTVTVNPLPAPISGSTNICIGQTATLSDTASGGTWASSNTGIATVTGTGIVSGVLPGTAIITYTLPTGCATTVNVLINSGPSAISGAMNTCIGTSTTLSDPTSGGTWTSTPGSGNATVSIAGVVTGASIGTATITYIVDGCPVTTAVTVNSLPLTISGAANICVGSAITLSDTPAGGTWSSPSGGGIVSVAVATGAVTGIGAGTAEITYSLGAGCTTTATVTVNPSPAIPEVAGADNICAGQTTTVTEASTGGTWSSSPDTIAAIIPVGTGTGLVTGIANGAVIISYTFGDGCAATTSVSVVVVPPITGISHLCAFGDTAHVLDAMPGGTWSSTLATVSLTGTAGDGLVTSYEAGLATITYTVASGCFSTTDITINPVPAPIAGTANLCAGTSTTLSDTAISGLWSSSAGSIATVGSTTGIVTSISAGTAIISYTLPVTGCMKTITVTVDPHPSIISGGGNVCAGATAILSDSVTGGTWTSSAAAIATVSAGIVTGLLPGTATITYSLGAGCTSSRTITVDPLPASYAVTGGGNYCSGTGGVHIGLSGADAGISYKLYHGSSLAGTIIGPAVDFGLETLAGTYTVAVTNIATGCGKNMPDSATVTITPSVIPSLIVTASPASTVCAGTPVTFTAVPVNGGLLPTYQWTVNSSIIPGISGSAYNYTPLDNDIITATLTSNAACAIPDTSSSSVTMTVVAPVIPSVTINATPGTNVQPGTSVTLTATVTGSSTPIYQWEINGNPVAGATTATFINIYNTADSVTCVVSSGDVCNAVGAGSVVIVVSNVGIAPPGLPQGEVTVLPNPNQGEFIIKGSLGSIDDEEVSIEVMDMLGQIIYKDKIAVTGGKINEHISLSNAVANGMYILNLTSAGGNKMFHIVTER